MAHSQHWQPLGFSKTEVNSSTLLATVLGIKHFLSRLEGCPFQLWTDHKPLIFALKRVSPPTSDHALSRPSAVRTARVCAAIANRAPLDLKDMALRQILCPQVQVFRSSPGLRIITRKFGVLDLIGDSSTGTFRPLMPRDLRRQVFEHLHGAAHPGRRATCRLISSR
jgi:hypothetical protein